MVVALAKMIMLFVITGGEPQSTVKGRVVVRKFYVKGGCIEEVMHHIYVDWHGRKHEGKHEQGWIQDFQKGEVWPGKVS